MRGEQLYHIRVQIWMLGSPPHARGAVSFLGVINKIQGITPACAGSSGSISIIGLRGRDHPRMRGEQAALSDYETYGEGSPPHARGADSPSIFHIGMRRITPACAGSSAFTLMALCWKRDHPRMRGEQAYGDLSEDGGQGSPPHARGAEITILPLQSSHRITPACAGSRLKKYRVIKDSSYSSIKFPLTSDRSHM